MGGQGIRFGRKTGATLKRPRGGRRNVSAHYSIRKTEKYVEPQNEGLISDTFAEQFDDGDLCSQLDNNGVEYSLNKRKRWTIPGFLKENIVTNPMNRDNSFQVRLVERQILGDSSKRADCIAVHSSKEEKHTHKPCKTFSLLEDLIKDAPSQKQKSRNKKRFTDEESMPEVDIPTMPEIRYEVAYPRSLDSFPNFNPSKISKSKIKTKRNRLDYLMEDFLDMEEEFWEENDDSEERVQCENEFRRPATNLGDFITSQGGISLQVKQREKEIEDRHFEKNLNENENRICPNQAAKQSWLYFGKDNKVIIQKKQRELPKKKIKVAKKSKKIREEDDDVEDNNCQNIPNICINICRDSCASENLLEEFGQEYVDGICQPRRFIINVTESVHKQLTDSDQLNVVRKMKFWGYECCVIFTTEDSCHNYIKTRLSLFGLKQSNTNIYLDAFQPSLDNSRVYTVSEVIDTVKRLIAVNPPKLYDFDSLSFELKPEMPFTNLRSVLNLNVEVMPPYLALKCMQDLNTTAANTQLVGTTATHSDTCGICDEYLSPSIVPYLALNSCQHWFCGECWRLHIESRIQRGDPLFLCPGHNCKSQVDDLSLMSLISGDQFLRHKVHALNRYVESNPEWYWFPRPQCGRVARIQGYASGHGFLTCDCGLESCLECKEKVHWPATCQQFKEYQEKMNLKRFLEQPLITKVQVKRCPACHQPMQKNGGCNMVTCRCRHMFCWQCLYIVDFCKCHSIGNFKKKFEFIKLEPVITVVAKMSLFDKALHHHTSFGGLKRRQLRKTANSVVVKMFVKYKRLGIQNQTAASSYDTSRLQDLLALTQDVLQFFFEAKRILEYGFVVISYYSRRDHCQEMFYQVLRLEHIVQRMEEILQGNCRHYSLDATETILRSLLTSGNNDLKLMAQTLKSNLRQPVH
ncbi:uncharacterized protein [Antedon mediterranea]|uniref:uncharacterized protein n=1 Tax=Antedon mediterranea TaxID=105859 RepID=UPI003AF9EBB4